MGNVGGQSHLRFRGATIIENSTPRMAEFSHDSSTTARGEFRRLTDIKIQQRREKGLCYRCTPLKKERAKWVGGARR